MKKIVSSFSFLLLIVVFFTQCNNQPQQADTSAAKDSTSATNDVTRNWKLGVQMWTFHYFPFVTALDKVDSAGVKFIEAFPGQKLGGDMKGEFGIKMDDSEKAKIKQLLQSKGIQIVAMGVITPSSIEEWKKYFDLAKEFGLSYITAEPKKDEWNQVDSLAGVYGIKIAIHDHPKPNMYWSPDSVLAAIQGHPNIGSCADVGHWSRNGLNPVDCIKKLAGHIYGVHLKDIKEFNKTDAADTVVGKGINDFPAIFQALKDAGFSGMLSIEQESNWYNSVPDVINTKKYFEEQVAKLK
ncbi:MAG: sugar phosphate isomerase/epimerase [Bacteroidetes bacterium]|nr:sugar phosphate isomerase/epimerase [Bacteroidota bacterium]